MGLRAALPALAALLLAACGGKVEVAQYRNPPPAEAFYAFGRFELRPVEISPQYEGPAPSAAAAQRMQEHFDELVRPTIAEWSRRASAQATRTLVIEPHIERLNYVSTPTRIFTGPYYGDAQIVMRLRYTEASSGKLIAEPRFFQDTGKWYAWVTVGVQDRAMLRRMAGLVSEYNKANYLKAVGGRTGPDDAPLRRDELPPKS
jgi:hypothetical protein